MDPNLRIDCASDGAYVYRKQVDTYRFGTLLVYLVVPERCMLLLAYDHATPVPKHYLPSFAEVYHLNCTMMHNYLVIR